jgi:hypothetical protein
MDINVFTIQECFKQNNPLLLDVLKNHVFVCCPFPLDHNLPPEGAVIPQGCHQVSNILSYLQKQRIKETIKSLLPGELKSDANFQKPRTTPSPAVRKVGKGEGE